MNSEMPFSSVIEYLDSTEYSDKEQFHADLADPRYSSNESFRKSVDAKLERSMQKLNITPAPRRNFQMEVRVIDGAVVTAEVSPFTPHSPLGHLKDAEPQPKEKIKGSVDENGVFTVESLYMR